MSRESDAPSLTPPKIWLLSFDDQEHRLAEVFAGPGDMRHQIGVYAIVVPSKIAKADVIDAPASTIRLRFMPVAQRS